MNRVQEILNIKHPVIQGPMAWIRMDTQFSPEFSQVGFSKLADKYAEHATEERGYLDKCIDRLIDLYQVCAANVEKEDNV